MKNKDASELANAYTLVQENWIKKAAATAAIAGTMGSAHAGNISSDDFADRANPPISQNIEQPEKPPLENLYPKAEEAYKYAINHKMVDETTLKLIALDKEIAQRYALHLIQNGQRLPDTIKHAISKQFDQDLKSTVSNQQD
jgi:hypothetical protein